MFDQLEKHHIGIVITNERRKLMEKDGVVFHKDSTQGTHVAFEMNDALGIYLEYIVQEGRAANIRTGFYHLCYNVPNQTIMKKIEEYIKFHKLGYPITKLEKSESDECGWIKFYFLKNQGVIELNLIEDPTV